MRKFRGILSCVFVAVFVFGIFCGTLTADDSGKVNINTATVKVLKKIKGLRRREAKKIVKYRDENGPFKNIEDILKIRTIGRDDFLLIKDAITVGE